MRLVAPPPLQSVLLPAPPLPLTAPALCPLPISPPRAADDRADGQPVGRLEGRVLQGARLHGACPPRTSHRPRPQRALAHAAASDRAAPRRPDVSDAPQVAPKDWTHWEDLPAPYK